MISLDNGDANDDTSTQRSSVDFVRYPRTLRFETYAALNRALEDLEDGTGRTKKDTVLGPFGAYDWLVQAQVSRSSEDGPDLSQEQASWIHWELVDSARLSIVAIKGPDYIPKDQNMLHILYPKFFPNIDSDDWLVPQTFLTELIIPLGHDLNVRPTFRTLLKHLHSTQFPFLKLYWTDNYWSQIVVPYINQLAGEYIGNYESWSGQYDENFTPDQLINNLKLAAVYLALGMTAFTLARDYPLYLSISLKIRKVCSTILNSHLDNYDSNSDYFSYDQIDYENLLLLCILLQVQCDSMFGVFENYNLSFAIGEYIVQNKFKDRELPNLPKFLLHTFTAANIFYASTQEVNVFNYSIDPNDINENYRDLDENYDLIEGLKEENDLSPLRGSTPGVTSAVATAHNSKKRKIDTLHLSDSFEPLVSVEGVYSMWGYKQQFLEFFLRIVHLTNHKSIFRSRKVFPRNFPKICAEMEDELTSLDLSKLGIPAQPFHLDLHEGLHRNAKCLHYAMRVYFARLIKEAPLRSYQQFIKLCLEELEQLLLMNDRTGHTYGVQPPFFVILICGSDALEPQVQEKVRELWSNEHFGWSNQWRAKQIVYEVWKRREEGENVSWMDLVREWDLVLYMG